MKQAKWNIGQLVHHKMFNYRGVIYDADPEFMLPEEWYEQVAKSRPPKDEPWYHVLVDGGDTMTYVAQRNLESDMDDDPIEHPLVGNYFSKFEDGHYIIDRPHN